MYKTLSLDSVITLKAELDKRLPLKSEDEKRLKKKFRLEFNYNSNHLEGNTLTYGQTQLLLLFDKSSGDVPVSDIEEMKAHDVALSLIEEMAKDNERPLTEQFIKELNKTILVKPFYKDAITADGAPTRKRIEIGQYKTSPNSVRLRNGEIHEYASPEETPSKMSDLMNWFRDNQDVIHPVQLAAEFHYRFVCIHPFDDGNGRVARLLMNYILLKNGYPIVIIKSDDKENYLTALQKADTGDRSAIVEYIERQAIWSLEISIKAANGEEIDELGDIEKEIEILKREKLTSSKIYKTPKVAFELITHIDNDLWTPLSKALAKFDDFFAEVYKETYVDQSKINENKILLRSITDSLQVFQTNRYIIFDRDLTQENIREITWTKKMLSLKTATKKIDHEISCSLQLNESNYKLVINEKNTNQTNPYKNYMILFDVTNEYKTLLMSDTVNSIIRTTSNYLIQQIKEEQ